MVYIQTDKTGGLLESVSLSLGEYSPKGYQREEGYLSGLSVAILLRRETPDPLRYLPEGAYPGELL